MFIQMHKNLRDAVQQSFNKPPTPKAKGLPKGVKLPFPFSPFGNMGNVVAKEAKQKATSSKYGFNDSQMIPGMSKPKAKPKPKPKAPPKPKGKWVTNKYGIEVWHPAGYDPNNDPNKGRYFKDQIRRNAREAPVRENTWQPEGDMIGFY